MNRSVTASAMAFGFLVGALSMITEPCMADDPNTESEDPTTAETRPGAFIPKALDLTEDQLKQVSPPSEESIRRRYGHIWSEPDESAPDWEKDPRILEDAVKEAERLGLDIDDYIIHADGDGLIEAVRNAKEERDIRAQEPSFEGGEDKGAVSGSVLDNYSDERAAQRQQQVADSAATMQHQTDMTQAAQAGDDAVREAASIIERAGRESQAQADQSARDSAHAARASGWGATVGDAVATGIQQGAEAFGAALGAAAADKAAGELFGSSKPEKPSSEPADSPATASGGEAPAPSAPASGQTRTPRSSAPCDKADSSKTAGTSSTEPDTERRQASSRRRSGTSTSSDDAGPMVTCPGCGRTFRGIAGQGVPCPYCVTMNCPRCGHSANYTRGQEPASCPRCAND